MAIPKLISTLLLLPLLLSVSGQRTYRKCPRKYQSGALFKCSTNFHNYCAFYKEDSDDSDTLQKLTANECTACSDKSVVGYSTQRCRADKVYCDSRVRPAFCTKEYTSICAYTSEDCNDDSCRRSGGNPCMACSDPTTLFYEKGECPQPVDSGDDVTNCELLDIPAVCPETSDPVCASQWNCVGEGCTATFNNGCSACSNGFRSFTNGECPQPVDSGDDVTNCELLDIPAVCPETSDPVCASRWNCTGEGCTATFNNGCSACSNGYRSFKSGECPQ